VTQVFTLPDLGEGLEEAQLVRWLVAVGDRVAVDEPVAEVETAKAMVEVPSPYAGVVAVLHGEEGDVIAVGSPLLSVDEPQQDRPERDQAEQDQAEPVTPRDGSASGNVLIGYGTSDAAERGAGRRAMRRAVAASGGEADGLASAAAAHPAADHAPAAVAVSSPLVRALAKASGVDLTTVQGTGPGGVITRADVERAGSSATTTPTSRSASTGTDTDPRTGLAVGRRIPVQGVRRTIASQLSRSRQEIPEATTWVDVDATDLMALRATLSAGGREGPGLLALVARFVVAALARFPELNARFDGEAGEIVLLDGVNLGIAAQTDRGLMVPVVRGADRLATRDLDRELRRLTAAVREGRATTADLTGGSFTLNSYGMLGVDGSAAIINHPEVAILGMGRVLPRPWVVDGAVAVRSVTQLSLVFDHRVCDGGTAGGFLRSVADAIESPVAALVDAGEL
jgi:2-oxoisovalerate dehydrogenase E2 component (dihydrolipoyl transacylase)